MIHILFFGNINHNNCVGDSIGTATVSSSGCVCQFSTCTYLWDNGSLIKHATNLGAGMHHVIITHPDGCVVEDSVLINDGNPVVNSYVINNESCYYSEMGLLSCIQVTPYQQYIIGQTIIIQILFLNLAQDLIG